MFKYRLYKTLRFFHLISKGKYKKKTSKYTEEYKTIARSKLFDAKWYLEQNPDVKAAKTDPIQHYLEYGWKEARQCTPYFDGNQYLKMYPDVAAANINPLVHYELFGKKEDRFAEIKQVKSCYLQDFRDKIRQILLYPQTVYEECQRLKFELKNLK